MHALLVSAVWVTGVAAAFDSSHGDYNAVLQTHVRDGLVDYSGLKNNREALDHYLQAAGQVPRVEFDGWTKDEQLAFLINVYNGSTLRFIVDNYPVDSIKSLGSLFGSPWSKKTVTLFGEQISLDDLEHGIIRKNYQEPRIHFALVCAAVGCPPLRDEAYRGESLDAQLEAQTKHFLSDQEKNRVDWEKKRLWLSPIFKWYGDDFEGKPGGVAKFVAPHVGAIEKGVDLASFGISYTDYDWSLNDQAR